MIIKPSSQESQTKNSLVRLAQIGFVLVLTMSTFSGVPGQTDSCSQLDGGTFSVLPNWQFDINEWCTETPTDVVTYGSNPVTCYGCLAGNVHHAPTFSKGGKDGCSNFSQQ